MQRLLRSALLLSITLLVSSCASIVHGTSQDIPVNSDPSGARILVNGEDKGATPTTLNLKRGRDYQLVFRLDGYEDVTLNLERKFLAGSSVVGNIFSWGLLGIVIDVANGAAYELTPEELDATLRQNDMASTIDAREGSIQVFFFNPDQVATAP